MICSNKHEGETVIPVFFKTLHGRNSHLRPHYLLLLHSLICQWHILVYFCRFLTCVLCGGQSSRKAGGTFSLGREDPDLIWRLGGGWVVGGLISLPRKKQNHVKEFLFLLAFGQAQCPLGFLGTTAIQVQGSWDGVGSAPQQPELVWKVSMEDI